MDDTRIATGLWVEAKLRELGREAISYYIVNKGAYFSGTVLLKINSLAGDCRVLTQIRDEHGILKWLSPLKAEIMVESEADAYIQRALQRDQDIWVIEIENRNLKNPFGEIDAE